MISNASVKGRRIDASALCRLGSLGCLFLRLGALRRPQSPLSCCRFRWSAPSAQCTCWATLLTTFPLLALTRFPRDLSLDDAIVVIENIRRYQQDNNASALSAALCGSEEIGFTVLSVSVSLIAVFIPILLMGGILGRIFREFALTLSIAVTLSMVISLTVTPAMCAKVLKTPNERKQSWFTLVGERAPSRSCTKVTPPAFAGSYDTNRLCWALRLATLC